MNKFLKLAVLVMTVAGFTACVQDLNTKPIDPNSSTKFDQDRMFTKCYSCMAVIGQSGPGENSDVDWPGLDAGTSGFYRTIWYCNELTTDEAWWIWKDKESNEMNLTNWAGDNTMIGAIYSRLMLDIKYCNHYLKHAADNTDELKYRKAEVRFIRALHYFYFLDLYLYIPYVVEDNTAFPHFLPRHELYAWLVDELKDLEVKLPAKPISKYRAAKSAAQLLLARIYLNADVYNKFNSAWNEGDALQDAYDKADELIKGHSLYDHKIITDSGFVYSAYQQLFMGDNDRDELMDEIIFPIYQDGMYAQSYASSTMLISGPRMSGMNAWGTESEWHSFRTSPTMVDKFLKPVGIDRETAKEMVYDEYEMPAQLHDDRAILCSSYSNPAYPDYKYTLNGDMEVGDTKHLFKSWAALKFTGVYSTASLPKWSPRKNKDWPDTDIPLLRRAEAYLIHGEAKARLAGNNWNEALEDVNALRARANADPLPSLTEEELLDEWSREFYFEGRRRMDLVRFGRFFGEKANSLRYHWEGRMGKPDGPQNFDASSEEYQNWFPIPSSDKRQNPNFKKDVEGDANNIYASQGGDGYGY